MKLFIELGITPPTLVITHGANIALECNNMNPDKVKNNQKEIIEITFAFIKKYYSELQKYVRYTQMEASEIQTPRIQERLQKLRNIQQITDNMGVTITDLLINLGINNAENILSIIQKPENNLNQEDKLLLATIAMKWFC